MSRDGALPQGSEAQALALAARLVLAHETDLKELKAGAEVDFLVADGRAKAELARANERENLGKRVRCFRAVLDHLAGTRGHTRLTAASDGELANLLLRFKPVFKTPAEGKWWKWTAALGVAVTPELRGALADLVAAGGHEAVSVRKPLLVAGKLAQDLEALVNPDRAERRKGKGKVKGKGRGKNKEGGAAMEVDSRAPATNLLGRSPTRSPSRGALNTGVSEGTAWGANPAATATGPATLAVAAPAMAPPPPYQEDREHSRTPREGRNSPARQADQTLREGGVA